jgi:hypothetical protein
MLYEAAHADDDVRNAPARRKAVDPDDAVTVRCTLALVYANSCARAVRRAVLGSDGLWTGEGVAFDADRRAVTGGHPGSARG